jgi:hypothetical protein
VSSFLFYSLQKNQTPSGQGSMNVNESGAGKSFLLVAFSIISVSNQDSM